MSGNDRTIQGDGTGITLVRGNFAGEMYADLPEEHTGRDHSGIIDGGRYR
jgi:hypothetical protein